MKKILMIALAVALVLALCVGCANQGGTAEPEPAPAEIKTVDNTKSVEEAYKVGDMGQGWPASDLPDGFPKYPGGDAYYEIYDDGTFIYVLGTDRNAYDNFLKALEDFGFAVGQPDEDGYQQAIMGSWMVSLGFYDADGVALILFSDWGYDIIGPDWPEMLPEYPDGEVTFIDLDKRGNYAMVISDSSQETMEKYSYTLIDAGWELENKNEDGTIIDLIKGDMSVSLGLNSNETTVVINLREIVPYEELEKVWPASDLPSGFPEYPGGDIHYVTLDTYGEVFIIIKNTDQKTIDAFKASVENSGWEFGAKTDSGYWYGKNGEQRIQISSLYENDMSVSILYSVD